MDSEPLPQVHVSIQKGLSMPSLQKCNNCCYPPKFHCPFCSPSFFKPTTFSRARVHMDCHLRKAVSVGECTIHRCANQCRTKSHFHCLYCKTTVIKKRDFTHHLANCLRSQQQRGPKLPQLSRVQTKGSLTPGEGGIPSYDTIIAPAHSNQLALTSKKVTFCDDDLVMMEEESVLSPREESDDYSSDVNITSDSDDQHSRGASSNQPETPIFEYDTVGMRRNTGPETSKCHKTVQTNMEKPQDCDEYYFMSLVKMFKKLSPQKKVEVRMKIERILFQAEFE